MDKLAESLPKQEPRKAEVSRPVSPTLSPNQLQQECATSETTLSVAYNQPNAVIYFTIDGSEPHSGSQRASKNRSGFSVKFDNGFRKERGQEADKRLRVKMVAVVDGVSSASSSYDILLHKSQKFRNAIPI